MANSVEKSKVEAEAIASVANEAKVLYARIKELMDHNSEQAIDWAAIVPPSYISEDENGNITGLHFSRHQVADAVGSLNEIVALLSGQNPSTGDHLGNLNLISRPLG